MDTFYHFDSVTGEYLNSTPASLDPLESQKADADVYMRPPANACIDTPPAAGANQAAVRRAGAWVVVPDYRGEIYWLADGSKHEITDLDVNLPAGALSSQPVTLASALAAALMRINYGYDAAIASITNTYPQSEIDTWHIQEAEARAFDADNTAAVPFLTAQAVAKGSTVADLVAIIIPKADAYKGVVAAALGKRQKLINEYNAAALLADAPGITAADAIV